jgi:type II secretory pathway pseudopilin PulG
MMNTSRRDRQAGYAVIVVVLLLALVAIALTAAVPRVLTQGRREREVELIFRGEQYRRAIGLFNRKFGRLPLSLDELLYTSQLSFLRRAWPDPMSSKGEWRVIRVGPSGEMIGSVTGRAGPNSQALAGSGQGTSRTTQEQTQGQTQRPPPSASASGSGPNPYPIIGVASTSTARSIRVYNDYQHYNQWEFIFDPVQDALRNASAGTASPQGATSGQPGTQNPPSGRPPRQRR